MPDARLLRATVGLLALWMAVALAVTAFGRLLAAGNELLYTVYRPDAIAIYRMDVNRGLAHQLRSSVRSGVAPVWSPDGTQIALIAYRLSDGQPRLYVMDEHGRAARPLAEDFRPNEPPAWSPDGKRLAFRSVINGVPRTVVVELATGTAAVINEDGASEGQGPPVWSPDGRWVVYISTRDLVPRLYAADPDCINRETGCRDNERAVIREAAPTGALPIWSSDGRRIAYVQIEAGYSRVYVAEVVCDDLAADCLANSRRVSREEGFDFTPRWSPDGAQLAYVSYVNGVSRLRLLDMSSGGLRTVSTCPGDLGVPAWSPDGRQIALLLQHARQLWICVVDLAGGAARQLNLPGILNMQPTWRPG